MVPDVGSWSPVIMLRVVLLPVERDRHERTMMVSDVRRELYEVNPHLVE